MKIIFASSSEIGLPLLEYLAGTGLLAGVLTAPDKPQGRGRTLQANPVKARALELGLAIGEFTSLRTESRTWVESLIPLIDGVPEERALIVFSYGRIFGPRFCALFDYTLNVHPSALPAYRGPSPLNFAIAEGVEDSEICLQTIAQGVDEGDILARLPLDLRGLDLHAASVRASELAVDLLSSVLPQLKEAYAARKVQPTTGMSYTRMLSKADGRIYWDLPALHIANHVRSLSPWPGAYDMLGKDRVILKEVKAWDELPEGAELFEPSLSEAPATEDPAHDARGAQATVEPGRLYQIAGKKGRLFVACKEGYLEILKLQRGPKTLDAASLLRGRIAAVAFGPKENDSLSSSNWPLRAGVL